MINTTDAPMIIEHQHKSLTYTPYETRWIPCSARFVCAGITPKAKGILQVYELKDGQMSLAEERQKAFGIKCGTFGASSFTQRSIATGDYDGGLAIWDLERLDTPSYSISKAHKSIINGIDGAGGLGVGGGAPELVTGSRDGCVRVWDPRVNEAVISLEPVEGQPTRDCWTVAFGNSFGDERCVCAGYDNGDIKLFDLRTNTMRWETNANNGVTCVQFDRPDIEMNKLVVTTLESRFRVFDMRTQHAEDGFVHVTEKAHKATVWLARHLPQNRDLWMTGGGNGGFNLYTYHYPKKRFKTHKDDTPVGVPGDVELLNSRVISTQPIVAFDWSPDREGLAVLACLDQTLRVYICTKLEKY
uniref:WD repeat-containing protein 92 n=1 Tax=Aureoumbra lagunensis TaxID=44058 RepID=A0A7S3K1G1_9STRA|mmetsp:Transcript_3785/g.5294  ORF Transcript_3785/g.5294 Transcript_3785/m.5294 type:complete len:358 (-) Transcript_3785:86-1159(-)